jgi:predicted glutamine amidotransferase
MCGIVGLIAKTKQGFYQPDVDVFSQMLVADSVRGTDGTGVFGVYNTGSVKWVKVASHPYALLTNSKWDSFSKAMTRSFDIVVGHNRKATAGDKTNENSHPFVHEHIILVHNGTVYDHAEMAKTDVDSHAIAHSIANVGYKETLKNLRGAFALVWFDMKDRVLRMVRNDQRPLYIGHSHTQIAFASEGYMLEWISNRNTKSWTDISLLPAATLLEINQKTKKVTTEKVEFYVWKTPTHPAMSCMWPVGLEDNPAYAPIVEDEEDQVTRIQKDHDDYSAETEKYLKLFPLGKSVTLIPVCLQEWTNEDGCDLRGFVRGNKDIVVRAYYMGKDRLTAVQDLMKSKVLTAEVSGVLYNPTNKVKTLHVKNCKPFDTYRTFNGNHLTADEWYKICDSKKCFKCHAKLKITDISETSVHIREAILASNKKAADMAMPFKGVEDPVWNLKGAAHGS